MMMLLSGLVWLVFAFFAIIVVVLTGIFGVVAGGLTLVFSLILGLFSRVFSFTRPLSPLFLVLTPLTLIGAALTTLLIALLAIVSLNPLLLLASPLIGLPVGAVLGAFIGFLRCMVLWTSPRMTSHQIA